jgi:hypothetical protein
MESQEDNQDGNSIWISSSDKKYVLTFADRDYLVLLIEKYCKDISFSEIFNKAFHQNFKYANDVFLYLQREYINCLNKIHNESIETLSKIADPAEIKHYSKLFTLRQLKLEWTYHEALLCLQQNTESKSDFSNPDIQDKLAEILCKLNEKINNMDHKIDKIDKQTEKPQEWETHHLAATWKIKYPALFDAIRKLKEKGKIDYINSKFNFKMDKGCVGLVLYNCGYNDYINAYPYILINEKPCKLITLQNCTKNREPEEWNKILAVIQGK